jgi:MFS family permease
MAERPRLFQGWKIVAAACFCYGFGISPAYYSWGFYFPELEAELGYSRTDLGWVFGVFTFLYSAIGPVGGFLQNRIGIRNTMILGAVMAAVGFVIVSQAHTKPAFLIGFSILGGCGVGLSTILPCQTLGQNWFLKRRALAIALIMSSGGFVAPFITKTDEWVIQNIGYGWRAGWLIIAAVSVLTAIVAYFFIRDTPESVGQHRDGVDGNDAAAVQAAAHDPGWTGWQALRTKQFFLITVAGIAYATPWGVVISHGRSHLTDNGLELSAIAAVMGMVGWFSIGGRLSGMLGDRISPQSIVSLALVLEGIGVAGFYFVEDKAFAYASLFLLGLGFGATYVSIPVIFSQYFGRKAFGTTAGVRIMITGVFNGLGPFVAGAFYDRVGSYFIPFMGLTALCFLGAFTAAISTSPGDPPNPARENTLEAEAAA